MLDSQTAYAGMSGRPDRGQMERLTSMRPRVRVACFQFSFEMLMASSCSRARRFCRTACPVKGFLVACSASSAAFFARSCAILAALARATLAASRTGARCCRRRATTAFLAAAMWGLPFQCVSTFVAYALTAFERVSVPWMTVCFLKWSSSLSFAHVGCLCEGAEVRGGDEYKLGAGGRQRLTFLRPWYHRTA